VAVYVDDWRQRATIGPLEAEWSHLLADTEEELHAFADRLGLRRRSYQRHRRHPALNHYDVPETLRRQAIALGARPVTWRQAGRMIRRWRRADPGARGAGPTAPGPDAKGQGAFEPGGRIPASSSARTRRATWAGSSRSQRPAEAM
jgi:Protein of unknown function (DUF4031)